MAASDFDLKLVELQRKSVGRLAAVEVFDEQAFEALLSYLCAKAEDIKHEHVISKQVVACLLEAVAVVEGRSPRIDSSRKKAAQLSAEFYQLLGIIAAGEGYNDRKPAAPQVV